MPRVFVPHIITEDNALGGSKIEKSLRFNGVDTYLSRTPGSAGNRKKYTISAWVKRSSIGGVHPIFNRYTANDEAGFLGLYINSDDYIYFTGWSTVYLKSSRLYRDLNGWSHIVLTVDTTQGTASDRVKLYFNGELQTLATYNAPSQDADLVINEASAEHMIGRYSSSYFDGYMAEINFVDGYQYDASYFGFTDGQTGMWMPKRYEGTYGTNGFYLDFGNASSGDEYQKYTVPTASFTNDSDTLLLINNNESNGSTTFTDSSSNGYSISGTGSIAHSTAQSKFGSSSILFDGSDDSLSVGGNGTLYSEMTASSNKTYEAFMYLNADDYTYIMSISSNQRYLGFYMDAGNGKFGFNGNHPNPYTSVQGFVPALDVPIGRWFHVFVQRNADGTMSVGFDGKILTDSVAEGADVSASGTTGPLKIGSQHYYGSTHRYFYDGYMDEIRMSDTPRYTALGGDGTCGQDYSGNNNNFAPINFSLGGLVKDSPTNNFATLNPLGRTNKTESEGNLETVATGGAWRTGSATFHMSSGKWYWELLVKDVGTYQMHGIVPDVRQNGKSNFNADIYPGSYSNEWGYRNNGILYNSASGTSSWGDTYTDGDILSFALDMDNGSLNIKKNNSATGSQITGISGEYRPAFTNWGTSSITNVNFGQDSSFTNNKLPQGYKDAFGRGDFYYPVPSGYQALCSTNLPPNVPSIIRPQKNFETLLYTGNGSTSQNITGLEFKPDLVWIKSRSSNSGHHSLMDRVRRGILGYDAALNSNQQIAEYSVSAFNFNDNNSIDVPYYGNDYSMNTNSETYVAWCWKAGGAAVTNTVGNISAQVSANDEAGFSIITYTGDGNTSGNVGTGLRSTQPLNWAIVKRRDSTSEWQVGHSASGQSNNFAYHLNLDDTSALSGSSPYHMGTQSATNGDRLYLAEGGLTSSATYVAYVWQERPGYSKFGSYTGNGSADGPFIHLGFRPAWFLQKKTSGTGSWYLFDNKRSGFNVDNDMLSPNLTDGEYDGQTYPRLDFLSNGIKWVDAGSSVHNASGATYVYMAFAEQPGFTNFDTFPNAR